MNRKPSERKPRTKKNSLTATSETHTQVQNKPDLNEIIHFYEPFKCKTKTQKDFINLINDKDIVIASGPAGVGKSYIAIARALELIKATNTPFSKILISKPAVEAGEELGFVKGTIREKMEPHVSSSLDIFDKLIGKANRMKLEELEYLQIQPLAYIRGKSIDNTVVIMEEAQNMTPSQMKTLLTRIGNNSKFVISGDLDQSDKYNNFKDSGLYDAINKHKNIEEIGFIEFDNSEIVRNPIISKILGNYKRQEYEPQKKTFVKKKKVNIWRRFLKFLNQKLDL